MIPLYLMVLDLASDHAEGVVARVVIDVDSAEACGASSRDPLLVGIVVHHDGGSGLADALFTANTQRRPEDFYKLLASQGGGGYDGNECFYFSSNVYHSYDLLQSPWNRLIPKIFKTNYLQ